MTLKLKIIIVVCLLVMLFAVIGQIKKRQLELKYAITWIVLPIIIAIIIAVPGALDKIAAMLGIYNVMNMIFFLGFLFSLVIIYTLTIASSRHSERIRQLTQMMALDEYDKRKREKIEEEKG